MSSSKVTAESFVQERMGRIEEALDLKDIAIDAIGNEADIRSMAFQVILHDLMQVRLGVANELMAISVGSDGDLTGGLDVAKISDDLAEISDAPKGKKKRAKLAGEISDFVNDAMLKCQADSNQVDFNQAVDAPKSEEKQVNFTGRISDFVNKVTSKPKADSNVSVDVESKPEGTDLTGFERARDSFVMDCILHHDAV